MTTVITQARLPKGLITQINDLIEKGIYTNKSDFLREAARELILKNQIGTINSNINSEKELKKIKKILSKEKIDLNKLNNI